MDKLQPEHLVSVRPVGPGNWSPDGELISFVWPNRAGTDHLWVCPAEGGWPRQISSKRIVLEMGEGTDRRDVWGGPQWSCHDRIVFPSISTFDSRQTSLWSVELDGKEAIELTRHNGSDFAPRWSPNGEQVAFVGNRNGRDDIQVVSSAGGVALQLTYDRWDNIDLDWSPDGATIAYISQRSDVDLFSNSICTVPAKGGPTRQVTHGDTFNDRSPRWSPDGKQIAFISNRDDDDDVWCVNADGSGLRKVTSGHGEKADPRWSPDGKQIAYTHMIGCNINLCVIPVAGGEPSIVASDGCNVAPRWSPCGKKLLYLRSGPDQPGDLWCKDVKAPASDLGSRLTYSDMGLLKNVRFSHSEIVKYKTVDGSEIEGLLYHPTEREAKPGPGIVYIHGGPNLAHVNGWYPLHQYLLQRGYTIFCPNYRGSTGYGKRFMEANIGEKAGGDVTDWVEAARYLRSLPQIDPQQIVIMGRSAGGYATLLALGQVPDVFQAGVAIAAPSSWLSYWEETELAWTRRFRMKLMGGLPSMYPELYRRRSPITYAANYRAPVLILHGAADAGVPKGQAQEMAAALAKFGKEHECVIYEGEGHQSSGVAAIVDAAERIERFLGSHLSARKTS